MESLENAVQPRPSGLPRAQSRLGTSRDPGLHEITESQSNARAAKSSMLPQTGLKRNNEFPQPDPKQRKTLMERAAEPYGAKQQNLAAATPAPRHAKANSIVGLNTGLKMPSVTSAGLPSKQSSLARPQTKSNHATSVGPGSRPPSVAGRPPGSFSKSVYGGARPTARPRPATAFGNYADLDEGSVGPNQQNAWDVDERLNNFESQWNAMKDAMTVSLSDKKTMEQVVELANNRASDLQKDRDMLTAKNTQLESELGELRQQVQTLTLDLETERRQHKFDLEDAMREHRHQLDLMRRELQDEADRAQRDRRLAVEELERRYQAEMESQRGEMAAEIREVQAQLGSREQDLSLALKRKDREIDDMRSHVESLRGDLDREATLKAGLQTRATDLTATNMALEDRIRALKAQVEFLESDSKQQSDSFASMEARLQDALRMAEEARQKLIREETERRVLFNKYQELKGNIRVMCRVRPVLDHASEGEEAAISFPDTKTSAQIDIAGPEEKSLVTGTVTRKTLPFEFDRVFTPEAQNEEVFAEISQLVQSALDGYNVCIFCYGQTGSGKTYTMSSPDGMIPRATKMIYETAEKLREKSWRYTMEGSFVEVYNEDLHDLLASSSSAPEASKKKLVIQHDEARRTTTVLNCRSVELDSPDRVEAMLRLAQNNRSVAATKANERSSRSHSVFILRLVGDNAATGERCEGTLNLVDLAGSERLKHSQAEGERMKETQNINKSLSCLGDVIEALGKGQGHVPYRNSKLTHLLQYSLGGNSKTLMFVMVSPLEAHLKETITSLRFATKVHNTHIGTAKATKKVREHRES